MSWHFSRALEAEFSRARCSDGEPCAQSSSTTTRAESSSPDRTTEVSTRFLSGTTSAHSTGDHGLDLWMSSQAGSRVRTSALQARALDLTECVPASGLSSHESFARFDRSSCSWRTRQPSLLGDLDECSGTWPRSGTMRNGECWERMPLERRIVESVFGLWMPTPTVSGNHNRKGSSATSGDGLATAVAKMAQHGGPLNPTWVEWLMGWPLGWTVCSASATGRSRSARPKRGGNSSPAEDGDD